jgi:hypothetical protein
LWDGIRPDVIARVKADCEGLKCSGFSPRQKEKAPAPIAIKARPVNEVTPAGKGRQKGDKTAMTPAGKGRQKGVTMRVKECREKA